MNKALFFPVMVIAVVFAVLFMGMWFGSYYPYQWHQYIYRYFWPWHAPQTPYYPQPVYCTQDARQCPDGSYVSRKPPNCEFAACPVTPAQGTISGKISIGPLCPVEPCYSYHNANVYLGRSIILNSQTKTYAAPIYIPLNADGSFRLQVPADTYIVNLNPCYELGCRTAFPRTALVTANTESVLNISIDTGIR